MCYVCVKACAVKLLRPADSEEEHGAGSVNISEAAESCEMCITCFLSHAYLSGDRAFFPWPSIRRHLYLQLGTCLP